MDKVVVQTRMLEEEEAAPKRVDPHSWDVYLLVDKPIKPANIRREMKETA
jgi:hypothetical protein